MIKAEKIKHCLDQAREKANQFKGNIHDVSTLKQAILSAELFQEIASIESMLDLPEDTMRLVFQARCAWRQGGSNIKPVDHDEAIAFDKMLESPTNQLYTEIAIILFEPEHLQALVAILLPNTKRCFRLTTPEIIPASIEKKDYAYYMEESLPKVTLDGTLALLAKQPATVEALNTCVFLDHFVFPLHAMQEYGFDRQRRLYDYLKSEHPELSLKIYSHNPHLRHLEVDIVQAKLGFMPLREAITALIRDLTLGDVLHKGKELRAGDDAEFGKERFLAYYDHISEDIKKKFDGLSVYSDERDENLALLVWRLRVAMEHPESESSICVQVLSGQFNSFLKTNSGNPLLTETFQQNFLKTLRIKYRPTLNVAFESNDFYYPNAMVNQLFSRVELVDSGVLLSLLAELPGQLYAGLLLNAWIRDISLCHQALVDAIMAGCFTAVELEAIIKKYPNLFAGVVIGGEENVVKLFSHLPASGYFNLVKAMIEGELIALVKVLKKIELPIFDRVQFCIALIRACKFYALRKFTKGLDTVEIRELFLSKTDEGETLFALAMRFYLQVESTFEGIKFRRSLDYADVLFLARNCPDARPYVNCSAFYLNNVFAQMLEDELFSYISENKEVLALIAGDRLLFAGCLSTLGGDKLSYLFMQLTNDGRNVFHHAMSGDGENVNKIVRLLPEVTVQTMLLQYDHEGNTPLSLATTIEHFLNLLKLIEPSKRLGAITSESIYLILSLQVIVMKFNIVNLLRVLALIPEVDKPKFRQLSIRSFEDSHFLQVENLLNLFIKQFFSKEILASAMIVHEILVCLGVDEAMLSVFNVVTSQVKSIEAMEHFVRGALFGSSSLNYEVVINIDSIFKQIVDPSLPFPKESIKNLSLPGRLLLLFFCPKGDRENATSECGYQAIQASTAGLPFPVQVTSKLEKRKRWGYLSDTPEYTRELCSFAVELNSVCFVEELIRFHEISELVLLEQAIINENEKIIEHLLMRKSKVLVPGSSHVREMTAIYVKDSHCFNPSIIGKLVQYGADIDRDQVEYTELNPSLLSVAIRRNFHGVNADKRQLNLVEALIKNGANVHARASSGDYYFSIARARDTKIIKLLINNLIKSEVAINSIPDNNINLLKRICYWFEKDISVFVDLLVKHGLSRDLLDAKFDKKSSMTPIAILIKRFKQSIHESEMQDFLDALAILLKNGANPVVWCDGIDAYTELLKLFEGDSVVMAILKPFADRHQAETAALQPVKAVKDKIAALSKRLSSELTAAMDVSLVGHYNNMLLKIREEDFLRKEAWLKKYFTVDHSAESLDSIRNDFKSDYVKMWRRNLNLLKFDIDPGAPGNQLLFEAVKILFKPKNMRDMLSILMPHIDLFHGIISDVNMFNLKTLFRILLMFVFYENKAFFMLELGCHSLSFHRKIQRDLTDRLGGEFVRRIYNHNEDFRSIASNLESLPAIAVDRLIEASPIKDDKFIYFDVFHYRIGEYFESMEFGSWPRVLRYINAEPYSIIIPKSSWRRIFLYEGNTNPFCVAMNEIDGFSNEQLKAIARIVFDLVVNGGMSAVTFREKAFYHMQQPVYVKALYDLYLNEFKKRYCQEGPDPLFFTRNNDRNKLIYRALRGFATAKEAAGYIQALIADLGEKILDTSPGLKLFFNVFHQFDYKDNHALLLPVSPRLG